MVWLRVPYHWLKQRYTSRQNENAQSHGQQDFPSHLHELVKTITRERATIPDIHVHKPGNFRGEPENVLYAQAYGRNEQNQTDQAENHAKSGEADGLDAEKRMLGHANCVVKTHGGKKKERNTGEKRENLIPGSALQPIRKWPQPSSEPECDRNGGDRDHGGVFGQKE